MNFAARAIARLKQMAGLTPVSTMYSGLLGYVRESYPGAWQNGVTVETPKNILAFSAVYACISLIANDVSKMCLQLMHEADSGVDEEVSISSPYARVLRKPNAYQTRIQFMMHWISCKLIHGNTYILKQRESVRGLVRALHILDPRLVLPMVAPDGSVFYRLGQDMLAQIDPAQTSDIYPASEVIHDRMVCLWHPLVGVAPIYACGMAATQGLRIQANSAKFFENMSRPSGILTAPGAISDATAKRLKESWEQNFSGLNIGRLAVVGDGLTYEAMTIPAEAAQLVQQLKMSVEDVARCFLVPMYKIAGGENPKFSNFSAMNQDYYTQCLQNLIESVEVLLDEGLELPDRYFVEMEMEGLMRMDPAGRAEIAAKAIGAGYLAPNEARDTENLPPVDGGDTPYLQQQNYSLADLAQRGPPVASATPVPALPAPMPSKSEEQIAQELTQALVERFTLEARAHA